MTIIAERTYLAKSSAGSRRRLVATVTSMCAFTFIFLRCFAVSALHFPEPSGTQDPAQHEPDGVDQAPGSESTGNQCNHCGLWSPSYQSHSAFSSFASFNSVTRERETKKNQILWCLSCFVSLPLKDTLKLVLLVSLRSFRHTRLAHSLRSLLTLRKEERRMRDEVSSVVCCLMKEEKRMNRASALGFHSLCSFLLSSLKHTPE